MQRLALAILAGVSLLGAPASAEGPAPSDTVAGPVQPKPPLKLTDAQKQRIVQEINGRDTLDKLPDGFTPAIGAKVPEQEALAEHPLPRPLVYEIAVLKEYYYAQLADRVLIIDPMSHTVADIVQR